MTAPHPNAPVCCAKCGGPVRLVCDAHGTDVILDLKFATVLPEGLIDPPISICPGTARDRLYRAVSSDALAPSRAPELAAALDLTVAHVGVELSWLAKHALIVRVRHGAYVRASSGGR